ncbi:phosphoglycerate kinase [candidate division MSBL1 archaeon SCGC-AAA382A20]|uniref:Phosphoglycerate kinase n=1 Tax=candidate division MSBL1 archaeon SCGC-AAA382A20 TaxID=1698280 RepID=A0A133VKF0_9EURY|nr:phosphoglycerate kinase [candidate division MSBL1 archaeon SCGC-AAA382A20]
MNFKTLDDFDFDGKTSFVRVDINSPINPDTGEILDDNRIRKCSETLTELAENGGKTAVIAHQGRPGGDDFTTLEKHCQKMSEVLGKEVDYIDDLFGPAAREAIKNLENGDILLLENARFYSEEVLNRSPEKQAETHFVQKLSPLGDIFVNDAFAAAHRSQPSIVGFAVKLPATAGKLMETELRELGKARDPKHPCVHVLGGAKVDDSLSLIEHVLEKGLADKVLTGGLVGQTLLASKSIDLGEVNLEFIKKEGFKDEIKYGEDLLSKYEEHILFPSDVRIEVSEKEAKVISIEDLPTEKYIYDIGDETIEKYSEVIGKAKTVVANGPLGVFEKPAFAVGTNELLKTISKANAFTVIGGGHLVAAARDLDIADKINHVSTGGGACLNFLSGEKLPAVEMLREVS